MPGLVGCLALKLPNFRPRGGAEGFWALLGGLGLLGFGGLGVFRGLGFRGLKVQQFRVLGFRVLLGG